MFSVFEPHQNFSTALWHFILVTGWKIKWRLPAVSPLMHHTTNITTLWCNPAPLNPLLRVVSLTSCKETRTSSLWVRCPAGCSMSPLSWACSEGGGAEAVWRTCWTSRVLLPSAGSAITAHEARRPHTIFTFTVHRLNIRQRPRSIFLYLCRGGQDPPVLLMLLFWGSPVSLRGCCDSSQRGLKKQKQAPLTFTWGAQEQLSITCFLSLTFSVNTCLLECLQNNHNLKHKVGSDYRICWTTGNHMFN